MIGAVPYTALRFGAYDGLKVLYKRVSSKAYCMSPLFIPIASEN